MKDWSKSLPSLRALVLASVAEALVVPVALLMSLGIQVNGFTGFRVSPEFLVQAAGAMLCIAIFAVFLGGIFSITSITPGQVDSTIGVRLALSALFMALILGPFQHIGASAAPIVCALSFFVVSALLHALLVCCRSERNGTEIVGSTDNSTPLPATPVQTSTWPPADPNQLLGREEVPCQMNATEVYADRVVLISGAGGSIGSELSHQVLACRPRKIVLFELSESALFKIHHTMLVAATGTNIEVLSVLGSVTDSRKVRRTLQEHGVQVVLHAAAYKHVPLVEINPLAGLSNNVVGTQTLATQSIATGVERFVLISSDKAVRPINVMGASKRLCELVVQDVARSLCGKVGPVFSIVRFGNVLGSSGSVLPLFYDQVRQGGPVTVTHPDVSRFFMTVREAVQLVLQAGSLARGGEIFVLDMGEPVKIETLARRVIQSAGLQVRDQDHPMGDIEIKFIGLRRGEKLSEELMLNGRRAPTSHPKIFTSIETGLSEFEFSAALQALRQALACDDEAGARANACRWVTGFGDAEFDASPSACPQDVGNLNLCFTGKTKGFTRTEKRRS